MKQYLLLGMALLGTLLLAACASCFQSHSNLLKECWMQRVDTCPKAWTRCVDGWFLTGEPNQTEQGRNICVYDPSFKQMGVKCAGEGPCLKPKPARASFTNIEVSGTFKVQLQGTDMPNSISILGPNNQAQQVMVKIHRGTLYLYQAEKSKMPLNKIIVRIGIRNLRHLTSHSPCLIEGRGLTSDCLIINSNGSGNILLAGRMNLVRVNQMGTGTITILGAVTPTLKMNVIGNGNVNISGRVGIQSITHHGNGRINIIGADTDCLQIHASGNGFTGIVGHVNLKQITALNHSCVYLYWVNGCDARVFVHNNARVGLAGTTKNLTVNTFDSARFDGSYLQSENVYVRTYDASHANVAPEQKLFASASDNSSIYYLGFPPDVSRYPTQNAVILAVLSNPLPQPCLKLSSCASAPVAQNDWTYRPAYK